jgi:asparagine synthase (glutamine-hydrolysing)
MCGISGIVCRHNNPVEKTEICTMNEQIAHRGPDGEGYFFGEYFAFGHRRLAILDLSDSGLQPMSYMNENYTITYNGEIYNYLELREILKGEGFEFSTETDTEVILAAYDMWGESCVEYFNGMWAFAIYDKKRSRLFCSRDRFGIKPFYYTQIGKRFVFGSEIKQLLIFKKEKHVNINILLDYLLYGMEEHTNETFFAGIYKLEQSHNLIYDLKSHTFEIKKYFDISISKKVEKLSENEAIKHLSKCLEESIILRLRSDVRVGTCLSGGLDSSSIAAIASEKYHANADKKFVAIHAKSIEKKTDESMFAHMVAEYCSLDMKIIEPQLEDITNIVDEVVYTQEEPFGGPSVFMQYFVMKKAREEGCIVMLDGQGGDETMFGYESYYPFYFASLLKHLAFHTYLKEIKQIKPFKLSKNKIVKNSFMLLIRDKFFFLERYIRRRRVNLKVPYGRKRLNELFVLTDFKSFQEREIMSRNLPHLLRYEDKNSMRHSVETRLPFVDYRFVINAISVDEKFKFKNGYLKYLLRKIVKKKLPSKIVWRTNKFGFEAPADMWINAHKAEMIAKIQHSSILISLIEVNEKIFDNHILLWRMYNIAVWEKVYGVTIEK